MKGLMCIVLFCMAAVLSESKFVDGPCPTNVGTVPNFRIKDYEGIWYTQYRTPFEDHVHGCTTTSIFYDSDNGYYMKTFTLANVNQSPVVKRFALYNNHLTGMFRTKPLGSSKSRTPLTNWVLDTDYKTYSVRFSCYNISDMSHQVLSLQTRKQFPKDSILNKVKKAASESGFSLRTVEEVTQEGCPKPKNPLDISPEDDSDE